MALLICLLVGTVSIGYRQWVSLYMYLINQAIIPGFFTWWFQSLKHQRERANLNLLVLFRKKILLKYSWHITFYKLLVYNIVIHNFFFFNLFNLFIWLCWVFISVRGLSLVAASGGHSSSRCAGLLLSRPLLLGSTGSRCAGSVVVAHGPSCSTACGIFPDQGSNPCPLHWQADSQPLHHQGSPLNLLNQFLAHFICSIHICWAEWDQKHLQTGVVRAEPPSPVTCPRGWAGSMLGLWTVWQFLSPWGTAAVTGQIARCPVCAGETLTGSKTFIKLYLVAFCHMLNHP